MGAAGQGPVVLVCVAGITGTVVFVTVGTTTGTVLLGMMGAMVWVGAGPVAVMGLWVAVGLRDWVEPGVILGVAVK